MVSKFKKTYLIVSSFLFCAGFSYAEDSQPAISKSSDNGSSVVSAEQQSLNNKEISKSQVTSLDDREMLLKLQQQVQELQGELQKIKSQNSSREDVGLFQGDSNGSNGNSKFTTYRSRVKNSNTKLGGGSVDSDVINDITPSDIVTNVNDNYSIIDLAHKPLGGIFNQNGGIDVGGSPAITTQGQVTYLGAYSGNNSIPIGQISSSLFASTLLGQREKFDDYSVFFGGFIESDAQVWFGNSITQANGAGKFPGNGQNIYLTSANLYFLSNIGHYVTAQFDFDTNETGAFSLGNAFVIFGNLDTSPFFITAGRNKLSVGSYGGGGTYTGGVTGFLAPGKVTNVSVNYKNQVLNANIAVFGSDDKRANFSTGLFYADQWTSNLSAGFNVGYVFNIAGAGSSAISSALANLNRSGDNVGAINIDSNLTYSALGGFINIAGGWANATRSEEFNGLGKGKALAGAWYTALNYSSIIFDRNTNFGVTYGQTYNAAAIPMSTSIASNNFGQTASGIKHQLVFSAQRAYFDNNVLFGPEYSYQKLYNGENMNTITLDMSVYI
ncbi:MAG: iron acquisition protein FupA [Francisella sp.]